MPTEAAASPGVAVGRPGLTLEVIGAVPSVPGADEAAAKTSDIRDGGEHRTRYAIGFYMCKA